MEDIAQLKQKEAKDMTLEEIKERYKDPEWMIILNRLIEEGKIKID